MPDLARLGFPLAEVDEQGDAVLTKVAGSGGRLTVATCKEQLLYEVLDPIENSGLPLARGVVWDTPVIRGGEIERQVSAGADFQAFAAAAVLSGQGRLVN